MRTTYYLLVPVIVNAASERAARGALREVRESLRVKIDTGGALHATAMTGKVKELRAHPDGIYSLRNVK